MENRSNQPDKMVSHSIARALILPAVLFMLLHGLNSFGAEEGESKEIRFDQLLDYKNVVVLNVYSNGIRIQHSDGIKTLRSVELPPEVRGKLGLAEPVSSDKTPTGTELDSQLSKETKFDSLLSYKNVVVTKVYPDGLKIQHADGVTKIQIEELPADVRVQFGLEEAGALKHRVNQARLAKESARLRPVYEKLAKQKLIVNADIIQAVSWGVLLAEFTTAQTTERREKRVPTVLRSGGPTGLHPNAPYTTITSYHTEWENDFTFFEDVIFVECEASNLSRGQVLQATIYPYGTYTYDTVGGRRKTIKRFTTSVADAAARLLGEE